MKKKGSQLGWLAAGLAVSGLAMTPALSRAIADTVEDGVSLKSLGSIGSFTVAGADPDLVAKFRLSALRGTNKFKFTPVGGNRSGDRAVTVVVRQQGSKAVMVRESVALASVGTKQLAPAKITPTSYSLGSAKGLKSFAIPVKSPSGNLPNLGEIGVGTTKSEDKPIGKISRFNTRFSLDAKSPVAAAPRALGASEKDYTLDVGGSYSVTKNIAVTAGVRYNNERDRMAPLTDSRQDSQAVYVGTQFRF